MTLVQLVAGGDVGGGGGSGDDTGSDEVVMACGGDEKWRAAQGGDWATCIIGNDRGE